MNPYALIVEDNVDLRYIFSEAFQDSGFEVTSVSTGGAALKRLALYSPDVIILDVGLPDMSGLDVLRQIRKQHPDTTIIIVSAHSRADDTPDANLADLFLHKPISIHSLIQLAQRLNTRTVA